MVRCVRLLTRGRLSCRDGGLAGIRGLSSRVRALTAKEVIEKEEKLRRKEAAIAQRKSSGNWKGLLLKEQAEEIFTRLKSDGEKGVVSSVDVRNVSRYLAFHGAIEQFGDFFEALEAKKLPVKTPYYVDFMMACIKAGEPAEVFTVYEDFQTTNLKGSPQMLMLLVRAAGGMGDMEEVNKIVKEFRVGKTPFDRRVHNTILKVFSDLEGSARCIKWMEMMQRDEIEPDAESYGILTEAYIAEGQMDKARQLVYEVKEKKIGVSNITYSAYIRHYCARGLFDEVDRVIRSMEAEGSTVGVDVYNAVIAAHTRRGNLKKALDLFYKMRSSGLKLGVVEYNVLMATVGKTENKRLLGGIMADMQEKNIDPNRYTYATMIKSYGEGRKFRLARDTFKEMRMKRLADTTAYNIMIRVCLARTMSREHDALEYLKEMAREGIPPDVVTYTTFIEHYGHMKDAEQAVHFFKEMEAAEIKADVVAYTALIGSLYKANECGKAIAYFHRMKRRGILPNLFTYTMVISAHCKAKELDEAYYVLEEMEKNGIAADVHIFQRVMIEEAKLGNFDKVLMMYADMKQRHLTLTPAIYKILLRTSIKHSDLGETELVMKEMAEKGVTPPDWAILGLLRRYAYHGDLNNVLNTLRVVVRRKLPMSGAINEALHLISYDRLNHATISRQIEQELKQIPGYCT